MITRTIGSFVVIMLYLDFLDRFEWEETNSFPASRVSNSINEDIESVVVALQKNIFYVSIFRGKFQHVVNGHFFIIALLQNTTFPLTFSVVFCVLLLGGPSFSSNLLPDFTQTDVISLDEIWGSHRFFKGGWMFHWLCCFQHILHFEKSFSVSQRKYAQFLDLRDAEQIWKDFLFSWECIRLLGIRWWM